MAAELEAGLAELAKRTSEFEAEYDRNVTSADIQADATWASLFARVKRIEHELAAAPPAGGCQHFIPRRRRYCAARARMGELYCSQHAADAASAAKLLSGGSATTVVLGRRHACKEASSAHSTAGERYDILSDASVTARVTHTGSGRKTNIGRRMKAMTDPLNRPEPLAAEQLPQWAQLLAPGPVLVDVGCAKGRFVQALAASVECAQSAEANRGSEVHEPVHAVRGAAACARLLDSESGRLTQPQAGMDGGEGGDYREAAAWRFVGIEIFAPLAEAAQQWAAGRAGVRNAAFVCAHAGLHGGAELLRVCAQLDVRVLCVQFPDPWGAHGAVQSKARTAAAERAEREPSAAAGEGGGGEEVCAGGMAVFAKAKYRRRRLFGSAGMARAMAQLLPAGGLFYGASDVAAVALEMRSAFDTCAGAFTEHQLHTQPEQCLADADAPADLDGVKSGADGRTWLRRTPFGIPTERELVCEVAWRPVYRFLLRRTALPLAAADE